MNKTATGYGEMPTPKSEYSAAQLTAQTALLDTVFPGFSLLSSAIYRYTAVDLSIYIPIFLGLGMTIFCTKYVSNWVWGVVQGYLMSTAEPVEETILEADKGSRIAGIDVNFSSPGITQRFNTSLLNAVKSS